MTRWTRMFSMLAVLAAMTLGATAGNAPPERQSRPGREGRERRQAMSPEQRAALEKAVGKWSAKAIADAVKLSPEKAAPFVEAYTAARADLMKRIMEARQSQDREKMREIMRELRGGEGAVQKVLDDHLTEEQAEKAQALTGFRGIDPSVRALVQAEVQDAKIEKALPVLVKYHTELSALMGKIRSQEIGREEAMNKLQEMRETTAKELAPIVGEDVANRWKERGGRMGMGRRGERGQRDERGQGAQRGAGGRAPVAP